MSAERFGALPLGELHADGVCSWCGQPGTVGPVSDSDAESMSFDLYRTIHPMTQAVCVVCVDVIACERRRYRKGNP